MNLAVNAMQAMGPAGGEARKLKIATAIAADLQNVTIEVTDSGSGISIEALPHLFESFFTTKSTGMGMGLPICRSIVEAHGGEISVANRNEGHGARFTIRLPTRQERSH